MNIFKGLRKSGISVNDITKLPQQVKDNAYNTKSNKITVRFFKDLSFKISEDILGEIVHTKDISVILFERPFEGCILYLEDCVYYNASKENELTIDAVKDYPFGIDYKSDLVKFNGVKYLNGNFTFQLFDKTQLAYYNKTYKFYIPMMINKIPLPIIRLDYADRILKPIDSKEVKRLSNISQVFLRQFIRLKLLERTGNRKDGIGWIALFFIILGMVLMTIINLFVG